MLDKYGLWKKITYVKDEGSNFNAMIVNFKYVVSCESFGLEESLQITYFGHVFSKAHYGIVEDSKGFTKIWNMFLFNWHKKICKSASLGPRSLGKVDINGTRVMWKVEFSP